ncbi:trihelix transcription factor ASR3-like isoform X1 [Solanum verrucosum]|uniref:trihelix transcription factor ASR3-like isoform X1 n=1 Tax=Solanum verrucosum TaxID=315347 RepID=UPI0020D03CC4|nr:trihelix transcription factor ASR3-like isoform X1 [Solanum verrucosum]
MDRLVSDQGGSSSNMFRDYRKGNWTVKETMVLLEAKKMDDERRMRRQEGKPTELRWKWVEDYCWRNGCLRSQNQCNDKWDNLMRDFKKVREYERRVVEASGEEIIRSYWKIEKNERKEKNLPTNMLPEIYEALVEVMDKKSQIVLLPSLPPTLQQQSTPLPLLPITTTVTQTDYTTNVPFTTMCDSSDPDHSSERSDSPAKKRRMRGGGEGTSGTSKCNINNSSQEVGSAISKSAAIIAEAIQSCEERGDRRHKELLSLHQRRLQIEESKAEINKEGINGLVDSINKLANSILALAGNKNQSTDPK